MDSFFKYLWVKLLITIPACFLAFTQSQVDIMFGVIYIVILDTILGMWVALKYRIFSSHQLSRVFNKIGTYGIAMGSVWIIAAVEPVLFGWVFRAVGLFIIVTELFSNFEKLALLGFKIPGRILSKLNRQFYEFIGLTENDKEEIAIDILKNRRSL
jgi:hypothetical protein